MEHYNTMKPKYRSLVHQLYDINKNKIKATNHYKCDKYKITILIVSGTLKVDVRSCMAHRFPLFLDNFNTLFILQNLRSH